MRTKTGVVCRYLRHCVLRRTQAGHVGVCKEGEKHVFFPNRQGRNSQKRQKNKEVLRNLFFDCRVEIGRFAVYGRQRVLFFHGNGQLFPCGFVRNAGANAL